MELIIIQFPFVFDKNKNFQDYYNQNYQSYLKKLDKLYNSKNVFEKYHIIPYNQKDNFK